MLNSSVNISNQSTTLRLVDEFRETKQQREIFNVELKSVE